MIDYTEKGRIKERERLENGKGGQRGREREGGGGREIEKEGEGGYIETKTNCVDLVYSGEH